MRAVLVLAVLLVGCGEGEGGDESPSPNGVWTFTLVDGPHSTTYSMCLIAVGGDISGRATIDSGHVRVETLETLGSYGYGQLFVSAWIPAQSWTIWSWDGIVTSETSAIGTMSLEGWPTIRDWPWTRVADYLGGDCP